MNEHIYLNREGEPELPPVVMLAEKKLSDGSTVYDLEFQRLTVACTSGYSARKAMAAIAEALKESATTEVTHL